MSKNPYNVTHELEDGVVMHFNMNTLAILEDVYNADLPRSEYKAAFQILDMLDGTYPPISVLRMFIYACLKKSLPAITLEDAGEYLGNYPEALEAIMLKISASSGATAEGETSQPAKKKSAK